MTKWKQIAVTAVALATTLSALSVDAIAGTPDDTKITADVLGAMAQHRDLGPPNQIYVTTHNHVVYLSGTAYNRLSVDNAIAIARAVPGVTRVVCTVGVGAGG